MNKDSKASQLTEERSRLRFSPLLRRLDSLSLCLCPLCNHTRCRCCHRCYRCGHLAGASLVTALSAKDRRSGISPVALRRRVGERQLSHPPPALDRVMASTHSGGHEQERRASESAAQSQHRRNDGQLPASQGDHAVEWALTDAESWVEIASQPSSSSLSSIGDEIITTGLRVGSHALGPRRKRRLQKQQPHQAAGSSQSSRIAAHSAAQGQTSSQEEYDETESEEDQVMTSSAENIDAPRPRLAAQQTAIGPAINSDSDDDDKATALGKPSSSPTFRPQPNAFSHPPNHLQHRSHSASASAPHRPPFHRPSMSQRSTRVHGGAPNFMSPASREDNDAVLRASLTTLLSYAAAAQGLSKKDEAAMAGPSGTGTGLRPSTQPMDLRLVPESGLMAEESPPPPGALHPPQPHNKALARTASNSSAPSSPASTSSRRDAATKGKRTASSAAQTRSTRATKKKRTSAVDGDSAAALLSPTLLTWVVSAGVVVLVSVVSFGAGYVIGREVGAQEAAMMGGLSGAEGNATTACGRELARSTSGGTLRRFRWGAGMARSIVAT